MTTSSTSSTSPVSPVSSPIEEAYQSAVDKLVWVQTQIKRTVDLSKEESLVLLHRLGLDERGRPLTIAPTASVVVRSKRSNSRKGSGTGNGSAE